VRDRLRKPSVPAWERFMPGEAEENIVVAGHTFALSLTECSIPARISAGNKSR
jgi:hypothetical protein